MIILSIKTKSHPLPAPATVFALRQNSEWSNDFANQGTMTFFFVKESERFQGDRFA